MAGVSDALHHSLEAVLGISSVFNDTLGAIGFVQGVHSLHVMAIAVFPGLLVVARVEVLHSVFEFVRNRSLRIG